MVGNIFFTDLKIQLHICYSVLRQHSSWLASKVKYMGFSKQRFIDFSHNVKDTSTSLYWELQYFFLFVSSVNELMVGCTSWSRKCLIKKNSFHTAFGIKKQDKPPLGLFVLNVKVGEDISFVFLSSQGPFHLSVSLLFLLLLLFFLLLSLLSLPFLFYHPLQIQDIQQNNDRHTLGKKRGF